MASISRFFQRLLRTPKTAVPSIGPDLTRFAEGDRVLVDGKKLSAPLQKNNRLELPNGYIAHNDILGQKPRALIPTNTGQKYRITSPGLDQYISLTPRKVTPVYASYASLIVSLLDIHVAAPTSTNENDAPLEILESGTGHGALTLHLARSVHAANPAPPYLPPPDSSLSGEDIRKGGGADEDAWMKHKKTRRAVIHSVELEGKYSTHAQKLVRGFRRGIYAPHVDFHVASIDAWVEAQRLQRQKLFDSKAEPFLTYAILDMPGVQHQLEHVADVIREGAVLVVFVPSVTQIGDCVRTITDKGLSLQMESVVELGEGVSNGRIWDVRLAGKRKGASRRPSGFKKFIETEDPSFKAKIIGQEQNVEAEVDAEAVAQEVDDDSVMVCRPKVGKMTIGGGFIGIWRKMDRDSSAAAHLPKR